MRISKGRCKYIKVKMTYKILLDNGHGVDTLGKRSPDGRMKEGVWNREIVKGIIKELDILGIEVVRLVPEDEDISLQERCNRANRIVKSNPDFNCLFISVHSNAGPENKWDNRFSGCEVYVCREASKESEHAAKCYYNAVKEFGLKGNRRVPDEGFWRAGFFVLKHTGCPAILTENLFMTNSKEVDYMLSDHGKRDIINMHVCAICKYIGIPYAIHKEDV